MSRVPQGSSRSSPLRWAEYLETGRCWGVTIQHYVKKIHEEDCASARALSFFTVAVSLLPRTVWAEVPGFARARVVAHCAPWPRGLRTAVQEKLKIQAGRKGPCALLLYSQEPADRNRATVRSTGAAVLQRLPPPTLVLGRDAQSACARGGARTRPPPARRTGAPIRAQASSLAPRRLVGRRPA